MDAFHYFGTDDLYLENVVRFLKPGDRETWERVAHGYGELMDAAGMRVARERALAAEDAPR